MVVQTNSEAASTTPNPTPAKRFYGVSKPYWKQDSSAPLLDTKVTLKVLLSSRSTLEEKEAVFKPFRELRESNNAVYEKVVQEMLAMLDNVGDNLFCKVRLPIPLPSLRTKLGSLGRLMAFTASGDDTLARKRGLLIALEACVRQPKGGVRALEKAAIKRIKRGFDHG